MENSQRLIHPPITEPLSFKNSIRKRSRASSAAGDSSTNNQNQVKRFKESRLKSNARTSGCKSRLLPGNVKAPTKHSKTRKGSKPKLGSLQNAVVLAPFYTLKKSFQKKLMNFYSLEKFKKMNHKTKMAKQQNTLFQYDIIELKPKTLNIKKEGNTKNKSKQKTKTVRTCRCKKNKERKIKNQRTNNNLKTKRKTSDKLTSNSEPAKFSGQSETKRKNMNLGPVTPTALKSELGSVPSFFLPKCQSLMAGPCISSSTLSSQSEFLSDSWETFSDSPSKEEYVEGALAISTSSFDCYLENLDKDDWDFSEIGKKCLKQKRVSKITDNASQKPCLSSSKHMNFEKKNSDGQIIDFTDREPATRLISSEESHHHLRPLKLKSRTKTKKSESEPGYSCHIQSPSSNRRNSSRCGSRVSSQAEHQETRSFGETSKRESFQVNSQEEVKEADNVMQNIPETLIKNNNLHVARPDTTCDKANIVRPKAPKEPSSSFTFTKDETGHENDVTKMSGIVPVESEPSETEMETETKENSDREASNLETESGGPHEGPTSQDP